MKNGKAKGKNASPRNNRVVIGSYSELFERRFGVWIRRAREKKEVDESIMESDGKMFGEYLELLGITE